jgi:hypothetical protein
VSNPAFCLQRAAAASQNPNAISSLRPGLARWCPSGRTLPWVCEKESPTPKRVGSYGRLCPIRPIRPIRPKGSSHPALANPHSAFEGLSRGLKARHVIAWAEGPGKRPPEKLPSALKARDNSAFPVGDEVTRLKHPVPLSPC